MTENPYTYHTLFVYVHMTEMIYIAMHTHIILREDVCII